MVHEILPPQTWRLWASPKGDVGRRQHERGEGDEGVASWAGCGAGLQRECAVAGPGARAWAGGAAVRLTGRGRVSRLSGVSAGGPSWAGRVGVRAVRAKSRPG